jgi:hypothetical protein
MAGLSREAGKTTRCTEREYSHGQMVEGTRECTWKTKSKGKVPFSGQTAGDTSESGRTESNTVEVLSWLPMDNKEMANGILERELDGRMSDCLTC